MTELPSHVEYGYVTARWIRTAADSTADSDRLPDTAPAAGAVTFTPVQPQHTLTDLSRPGYNVGVVRTPKTYNLGTTGELTDAEGGRGAALICGDYNVTITIAGWSQPRFMVTILPEHTEENPLDLLRFEDPLPPGEPVTPPLPPPGEGTPVPTALTYGKVVGRWILSSADTPGDPDRLPDANAARGRVVLTPQVPRLIVSDPDRPGFYVGVARDTYVYSLDATGQLVSDDGLPGAWLVVGNYDVELRLASGAWPRFAVTVTEDHTAQSPLDLLPFTPRATGPTILPVVTDESRFAAEAAALRAEAADAAVTARSVTILKHGTNETMPRPDGAALVWWIGTATPANAHESDVWTSS